MNKRKVSARNRGGLAGFRGSEYERFFGTYRIVVASERHVRGIESELALQLIGADVDDWVERADGAEHYFQLRRREQQSWSAVRTAFLAQRKRTPKAKLYLVVHKADLARILRDSKERPAKAKVELFPDYKTPLEHILQDGPSRTALLAACVVPGATTSDLQWIWKELAHSWENVRIPGRFRPIREVLRRLPDHSGMPLRLAWVPTAEWKRAQTILKCITGVTLRIEDGSFFYSTSTRIEGRMSCRSSDFRKFVKRVISQRPKSVKRFEELL